MPSIFRFKDHIINIAPEEILMVTPMEVLDSVEVESSTWFKSSVVQDFDIYTVFVDTAWSEYTFEFPTEEERSEFISALYDYLNADNVVEVLTEALADQPAVSSSRVATKKASSSKSKLAK